MEKKKFVFSFTCLFIFAVFLSIITIKFSEEPQNIFASEEKNSESITAFPSIFTADMQEVKNNEGNNSYKADLKLFGIIPFKKVGVTIVPEKTLIPSGQTFGVKFFTKGVMVVGMSDVKTEKGSENPAFNAGIRVRDIILSIDGKEVNTIEEVSLIVEEGQGKTMVFLVKRNAATFEAKVTPKKSSRDELFKIGAWIRDSTAGIGTITFIDPKNGNFGGLGHGICDVDTGDLLPLSKANVYKAKINGVKKGERGVPGELRGSFIEELTFGQLSMNSEQGVFGSLNGSFDSDKELKIAYKQDIKEGKAKILCTVEDTSPQYFDVEIIKIYRNEASGSKNMLIKITDERLLAITGGIVQGMSGSPIIQNDMLIGAVTHVLVNDPTKGFGIFIENMLISSGELKKIA